MDSETTFEEFATLATQGTFVPVCKEVMADMLTPVSAFLKVAEQAEHAFLFESVEGGERLAGIRFSERTRSWCSGPGMGNASSIRQARGRSETTRFSMSCVR